MVPVTEYSLIQGLCVMIFASKIYIRISIRIACNVASSYKGTNFFSKIYPSPLGINNNVIQRNFKILKDRKNGNKNDGKITLKNQIKQFVVNDIINETILK